MQAEFPRFGGLRSEICRLAPCIMVHYLAITGLLRITDGNQVAPLTREHPRRRYTPVDYPCFTFCMYFTRIPNESKIHFGIHIRYIKIHVS